MQSVFNLIYRLLNFSLKLSCYLNIDFIKLVSVIATFIIVKTLVGLRM
jgi:hypothetical protein